MSSQGPNSAGTGADDTSFSTGNNAWSNTSNVTSSNNSYATVALNPFFSPHSLFASNFGFSVPAGATINGLLIEVEWKSDVAGYDFGTCAVGLAGGSQKGYSLASAVVPTTEAYSSFGGSSDTWNQGLLTPTIVNDSTFGFVIPGGASNSTGSALTISVDHVRATVYYTVPPTITETGTLSDFGNVAVGSTSSEQTFTVAGSNLTANIVVTAPSHFEVSTSSGSGFGSSVTLTQSGGTVNTTTIYVHFKPTSGGAKSGNITCTSTGATTQNVAVSGTGLSGSPPRILGMSQAVNRASTY